MYAILKALFIKEGSPTVIQSDNGGEFIGEVVQKLCKEFEVCMVHGRPHHPQSQGQIENLNKQVKRLLARFLQQLPRDLQANVWPLLLSAIADLLNCKWHNTINDVPFRIYKRATESLPARWYKLPVFITFSMVQSFGRETESKTWEVQFLVISPVTRNTLTACHVLENKKKLHAFIPAARIVRFRWLLIVGSSV